jgi:2-keto-4-pentenoate hydratase/2-oxohepta-3-ene-1,7-dioic acid hydratase in catechol pathway
LIRENLTYYSTSGLLFKVQELNEFIYEIMTFLPEGDLMLTGTSSGVGPNEAGP